jgi:DNA-binding response OmpR family regulator
MRVLLVEADSRLAAMIRQGLEEHGFGVDVSGDAFTGLSLARSNDYDAILLAVKLPARAASRCCASCAGAAALSP